MLTQLKENCGPLTQAGMFGESGVESAAAREETIISSANRIK